MNVTSHSLINKFISVKYPLYTASRRLFEPCHRLDTLYEKDAIFLIKDYHSYKEGTTELTLVDQDLKITYLPYFDGLLTIYFQAIDT